MKRAPLNVWASDIQAAVNGLDGTNFGAGALAADHVLRAAVAGDANPRLAIQSDGKLVFGSGSGAGDTTLYRSAADILKTDDSLVVAGTVSVVGNYGITLPASPTDGMEYVLVNSVTAPTYQWRFRYNAGSSSAYKWEFVGGSPARSDVATGESTASATPVDLTTTQWITLPRAGDYDVLYGCDASNTGAGNANSANITVGGATLSTGLHTTPVANYGEAIVRADTLLGRAASDIAKLQFNITFGGTGTFARRYLRVTPVRVS